MSKTEDKPQLTHIDQEGRMRMVDVSAKPSTHRVAEASGRVRLSPEALAQVLERRAKKGDVLTAAELAGVMAAKRTPDLIPLCHPLPITGVNIEITPNTEDSSLEVIARVKVSGQTGVEMEALTAASVACLTIYDMLKAVDRTMSIENIALTSKSGGASGDFRR